jgi:hypothetical protein
MDSSIIDVACSIVVLPTEDKTHIHIYENGRYMYTNSKVRSSNVKNGYQGQHAYVVVPQAVEKIKKDDWCLNQFSGSIFKNINLESDGNVVKIIATTDPKLLILIAKPISDKDPGRIGSLPQVQQSFLKEFVTNPNGKFAVEYLRGSDGHYDTFGVWYWKALMPLMPRDNKDNTINITSIDKKMYSREEVEELVYSAMKSRNYTPVIEFNNWVSENL